METSSGGDEDCFPATEQLIGHLLRRAQQEHVGLWSSLGPAELTSPQFAVLLDLARFPLASQVEVGERTGIDRSTLAEMVGRMVQRGLVHRTEDPADRRRKVLANSDEGTRQLKEGLPLVSQLNQQLVSLLTNAEQDQLRELLMKVLR